MGAHDCEELSRMKSRQQRNANINLAVHSTPTEPLEIVPRIRHDAENGAIKETCLGSLGECIKGIC